MSTKIPVDIRTHHRIEFRRCRRRWGFKGGLIQNKGEIEPSIYLWMGTGFHFALEDYHGFKKFPTAAGAFAAYTDACRRTPGYQMPDDWKEGQELAEGMLDYYEVWMVGRDPLPTLWIDGIPQCEVRFRIPLPIDHPKYEIYARGTLDRVCIDEHGRLWIVEYKTAKRFETGHFDTDPQCNTYAWAGKVVYDRPVAGVIYQQHFKAIPEKPEFLKSGSFSCNKNQHTSHRLYRQALLDLYGDLKLAPAKNLEFLNNLTMEETAESDRYVRRDWVYRNDHQIQSEGVKMLMEIEEMLREDLPLYPTPTRDCSWDCKMLTACVSMDDGSDWEYALEHILQDSTQEDDSWRTHLQVA